MTITQIPDDLLDCVSGGTNGVIAGPNGEGCTDPQVPQLPTLPGFPEGQTLN